MRGNMGTSTFNHAKTRGLAVIIVDDDPAVRASLQFALEVEGFTVHAFATGEEFLESHMPAHGCLVLDYKMPGLNGLQLLDRIRAKGHDVPAILITSNPSPSTREGAARAGVVIIEKPLLGNTLSDAIRKALEHDPDR
jgi:two-component system, LuxR family, response regulator FixJ